MNQNNISSAHEIESVDQLRRRVLARLFGRVANFQLVAHECGLVLRGLARSFHAKQLAQHAVMTECALPILANEIEVH